MEKQGKVNKRNKFVAKLKEDVDKFIQEHGQKLYVSLSLCFGAMDANEDGIISMDEFNNFHTAFMQSTPEAEKAGV